MPVRGHNGIIHEVREPARRDYHGLTLCGLMYMTKRKGTKWTPTKFTHGTVLYRMRPSSRMPTCIACATDAGKKH